MQVLGALIVAVALVSSVTASNRALSLLPTPRLVEILYLGGELAVKETFDLITALERNLKDGQESDAKEVAIQLRELLDFRSADPAEIGPIGYLDKHSGLVRSKNLKRYLDHLYFAKRNALRFLNQREASSTPEVRKLLSSLNDLSDSDATGTLALLKSLSTELTNNKQLQSFKQLVLSLVLLGDPQSRCEFLRIKPNVLDSKPRISEFIEHYMPSAVERCVAYLEQQFETIQLNHEEATKPVEDLLSLVMRGVDIRDNNDLISSASALAHFLKADTIRMDPIRVVLKAVQSSIKCNNFDYEKLFGFTDSDVKNINAMYKKVRWNY